MSNIVITDEMVDRAGKLLVLSGKLSGDWHDIVRGALNAALSPPVFRSGPDTRWRKERRAAQRPADERGRHYRTSCDDYSPDTRKTQRRTDTPREERRKGVEAPSGAEAKQACDHSWSESTMYGDFVCCKCGARHGNRRVSTAKPDMGIPTSPTDIPVSEEMLGAAVMASDKLAWSGCGRENYYTQVYRAMRAKEIEEQGTARRKGDPACT